MKMEKRLTAEKNVARELAYTAINELEIPGYVSLGKIAEGIVFQDSATGFSVVVRAIAKEADFDGEFEVEDYTESQEKKAKEKKAKQEKAALDKAKKEKEKKEKEEQKKKEKEEETEEETEE